MRKAKTEEIEAALTKTRGMISLAAQSLGISRMTIYRRIEAEPHLKELIDDARDQTTDIAELALFRAIQAGEPWAVKYYLDSFGRGRGYGEPRKIDVTSGGQPIAREITFRVVRPDDDGK